MASDERHPRIRQRHAVQTDVGVIRDHNEDAAYADPEGDFFIVADGMGGHAAGEVASKMAVEAVTAALQNTRAEIGEFARAPSDEGRRALVSALENAVRQAHQSVYQRGAAETDKQGMGTTLDVLLIAGSEAFVAHVGDSRTYLVRDKRAAQITTDHTVAEVLVIEGKLSIEEAQISPLRTILVNAIGVAPDVGVEMAHVRLRTGDRLLVCSDGLHDYFPLEQEVSDFVSENDPVEALNKMITAAKNRGGHDNITGIVLEVLETLDVASSDDDDIEAPRRVGYEDTGNIPLVSDEDDDAIPIEISRDDTAPVADKGSEPERAPARKNGSQSVPLDGERKPSPPKQGAKPDEAAKPEAAKPDAAKPGAAKPDAAKPDAAKPDAAKPDAAKPDAKPDAGPAEAGKQASPAAEDAEPRAVSEDETTAPSGGEKKKERRAAGKPERKLRGASRDRKEIESADTDELPAEPGDETARRSRSD